MVSTGSALERASELLDYAATLPGAWVGHKPEWGTSVASIGPRLFALLLTHTDGRLIVNVKLDPEDAIAVRHSIPWTEPGFHQSKRHWVSIDLTAPGYDADTAHELVEDSYRLVHSLLPRAVQQALRLAATTAEASRPTWQW
ncbi:MmcQ/YjbR family DNA-binding protein [Actinomyces gaoshouyii]|uniref:MmcQ/YjbR family DNA-binding protein n=1 Tax=Actinomyces gaoshouyii TaxID=1960083 RepID=UPI0009BE9C83|nr:MmcQ/YjbR family DNA-binding protein [Actinomyces gaoshouyii]ARD41073.1 hypothetical protein B6G06_00645 [Actinomyces gaoshouyii]